MNIYGYQQHSTGRGFVFNRSRRPLSDGPGSASLLSHLKAAGNVTERTEWSEQRAVKLYRPVDFSYAKSWVKNTRYLLDCERASILEAISIAERDRTIWLSFE